MKLSIVIPIYNAERYIEECLVSILPEMNNDMELLLIDDGSKDLSYQLIQKYKKENIRVFHHENHGVSYTRNVGILEARGDYIQFVDADDRLSQGWGNVVLSGCDEIADVVYYGKNFDEQENIEKINIIHGIFGIPDSKCNANMSSPCSKLYRREFLLKNQIRFDGGLINGEDGIFNLNAILKAEHFVCCKASYYQYRIYMGSSSKKYSDKFYDSNLRYFSLAENLLKNNNVEDHEIARCMSYAVTYSVYLYLFLISNFCDSAQRKEQERKIYRGGMREYMNSYPGSRDCTKVVQIVYWLSKHNCFWGTKQIFNLRNRVRSGKEKGKMKWEMI